MNVEIFNKPISFSIYGYSGIVKNKSYVETAFGLMDRMWQIVKSNNLSNKGLNIWIYEPSEKIFAGVELNHPPQWDTGLEQKNITLQKYAYYKHVSPYSLISQAGKIMNDELEKKGFKAGLPYLEIYGHWTEDVNKLETELIFSIE
ncbi:MAG TPA: GyrI-like domain-containing protein [Ignavibacteriaceae bacterium]|nr:GyrI-like domain-containing protein [Ignavibacteriaceae bacterium]